VEWNSEMTDQQELWDRERAKRHAGWARIASRLYYAPFARRIAASLSSTENEPILVDLGTGPGVLAIEVHRILPHARVIGVDPSAEMLEIARGNAVESGMLNFEGRLGRAEEIPIETNSVDLVFSQFSFHEWQDPAKGLSEVFRILKRGGSVVLRDFNRAWFSGWKRGLVKLVSSAIGECYEDHLEMFRFSFEEVASLLREAGLAEIEGKGKGLVLFAQGAKG
jgi:ubiquinone/menaquinone biosynthesis C-methylase UbiE